MMPPKKSKAARASKLEEESSKMKDAATENGQDNTEKKKKVVHHKNVFQETLVEGKRKRTLPPAEAKMVEWFSLHLEPKEGVHYKQSELHNAFTEECIADGIPGVEEVFFRKRLQDNFPNGYAIKEDSDYFNEIKQRKKIVRAKVQGDTLKLKRRDVIERAFKDLGNPAHGLHFSTLRKYVVGKFPALQVDVRPQYVMQALDTGVNWGYIELLRGVKRSGVYRWYVEGRDVDAEIQAEKEKALKKHKKQGKEGEEVDGENKSEGAAEDEKSQEGKDDSADKEGEEGKGDAEKKKKKKAKPSIPKSRKDAIRHGQPERIEDCFPLALTFGSEPKQCSTQKMATYISRHYPGVEVDQRLKPCLERGQEKGFWEHVYGNTYQLTVDEFDPTDDDDMIGKVVNAIMACTEPKQCSAGLLKNYVVEFHPEFKVADLPHKFKKALERAENCGDIIRLSGIGGSGSFQLAYQFQPSPVILAAQDTDSDYAGSEAGDFKAASGKDVDITAYQDAYVPRPSQRRGKARQCAGSSFFDRQLMFAAEMDKPQRNPAANTNRRAKKAKKVAVKKEVAKPAKKSTKGKVKKSKKAEKQTPTKAALKAKPQALKNGTPASKGRGRKSAGTPKYVEESEEEEEPEPEVKSEPEPEPEVESEPESEPEPEMKKKATPAKVKAKKQTAGSRARKRVSAEPEETPTKRTSRNAGVKSKYTEVSDEEDELDDGPTPPKKAKKGKAGKGGKKRR